MHDVIICVILCNLMHTLPLQKERRTALMFAAKNGVFSIVQLLLKFKPDVNIKDSVSYHIIEYLKHCHSTHLIHYCLSTYRATKLLSTWHRVLRSDTVSKWPR